MNNKQSSRPDRFSTVSVLPLLTFGNSGLTDLSITLEVRISLSVAPISLRRKFVGILPAAADFWR